MDRLENRFLTKLPLEVRRRLQNELAAVQVSRGLVASGPGETPAMVYFPLSCVFSVVTSAAEGQTVENAMIGPEGLTAMSLSGALPNTSVVCQVGGQAFCLPFASFRQLATEREFLPVLAQFWKVLLSDICQAASCQAFHDIKSRLATWLLRVQDRLRSDNLVLTQESMALVLGVQRPSVTIAARRLQDSRLIAYRYSRVAILDREGLEGESCACRNTDHTKDGWAPAFSRAVEDGASPPQPSFVTGPRRDGAIATRNAAARDGYRA